MYFRHRAWQKLILPRISVSFPALCPNCLSSAPSVAVFEASRSKAVGINRSEFLHLEIPYCAFCGEQINRRRSIATKIGIVLGIISFGLLWFFAYVDVFDWRASVSMTIGLCFMFSWPLHELWANNKRAVVLKRYGGKVVEVKIRDLAYHQALRQINS